MTRQKAIELVKKHMIQKPKNIKLFFEWLGVTESGFNYLIDQHRNKSLWFRNENWDWKFKSEIFDNLKLNKKESKWKWHISILLFILFTLLIGVIIVAITLSQMQFSR
jgi:uncharacterized membrane protein